MSYLSLEIRQALAHSCYKPFLEHVRKACLFHGCFVFHESSKQRLKTMCVLNPEIEHNIRDSAKEHLTFYLLLHIYLKYGCQNLIQF